MAQNKHYLINLMDKSRFEITVMVQFDGGVWEEKFRNAGIRVISDWSIQRISKNPMIKLDNLIKRIRIRHARKKDGKGLVRLCCHNRFDVIVSFNVTSMHQVGFSGKAKTVKYIHGDMATCESCYRNIMSIGDTLKRFDRIVCVSNTARNSFEKLTGITEGVSIHYNPINSTHIRQLAQQEIPITASLPVICAVGRLSAEKGFDRLIRIHRSILDQGVRHSLVIVGDGPEKESLIDLIRENQVEDSVLLAGYTINPYPYMKNSKFLVCSSYTEGLGLVAMEALCLGVPIVAAVPSVGEVLGDEACGIITENDDKCLEKGILRLLTDEEFYQRVKAGAKKRGAVFEGSCMVKEVEELFIELANEKNTGG